MASSSAPRFRVYSKYLFLTYPQCTLEPQYALDSLRTLLNKYEPLYIAAVRELHEDGSPHLHVLVQNKLRASITNPNALNLRMDTSPFSIFHPNIQAAKDCNQVRDYITKEVDSDANTAEWGTFVAVSTPGRKDRDADMNQLLVRLRRRCHCFAVTVLARTAYSFYKCNISGCCISFSMFLCEGCFLL